MRSLPDSGHGPGVAPGEDEGRVLQGREPPGGGRSTPVWPAQAAAVMTAMRASEGELYRSAGQMPVRAIER